MTCEVYFYKFLVTKQVFYKSKHSFALVNLKPLVPGHVLVVPLRTSVLKLADLTLEESIDYMKTLQIVHKSIKQIYKADSLNIAIQDGPEAGQSIPHLHTHIIPRYKTDGFNDSIYSKLENKDIYIDFFNRKELRESFKPIDDGNRIERDDDIMYDEIQWKSPEFIQARGLNTSNVLEYFSLSPFYDRTSNNQVLTMQFQFQQISIPMNMTFQQYFQSRLAEMTGIEFILAYIREPDFWIIRKQNRKDSTNVLILQDYYVIGANVYQAPKIYDVLSSRLLSSILSLKNSINSVNNMSKYQVSDGGHTYKSTPMSNSNTMTPMTPMPNNKDDIKSNAFDTLLNESRDKQVYLDEIPLYGKNSTLEMLGIKH
ncbi:unnamed protein product [Candida verbasci]|uniref:Multifunctional fusion protein n=1 Tax=Candida verbasci TaxID=1227364 RepID=A0A9W4TTX9_9ASCO|nr:unnamed protein product [Candida verbasci]